MSFEKKQPWWTAAEEAASTTCNSVPTEWIYGMLYYESGSFSNNGSNIGYNFGNLVQTQNNSNPAAVDGYYYVIFDSIHTYAVALGQQLNSYKDIDKCKSIEEFVQCLTDNKYRAYANADLSVYPAQIRSAVGGDECANPKGTGYSQITEDNVQGVYINDIAGERYDGMTEPTKKFINILTNKFYQKTNVTVHLSSGYRPDDSGSFHSDGIAFDVWADDFDNNNDLQDVYTDLAKSMGGTPLNEYPGREGEGYAHGSNIHVTVHNQDGNFSTSGCGTGSGGGPASKSGTASSDALCEVKPITPPGTILVRVKPPGKTFCEPIHPDLVAVTGNVPKALAAAAIKATTTKDQSDDGLYTVSLDSIQKATGMDFTGFFSDTATIAKSQQLFDPTKFKTQKKPATKGRPVNNTDPYPVDLKIEELETHQPRVKIHELKLCKPSSADITIAKATLLTSDRAEKRIVKLENMLSTLYRYVFASASRFTVNCVYYGGQDRYAKYKCIRCMRDDRIEDGAQMQLDQCLTCTRYEPVIGQTYEILDTEYRPTLGLVLDDMQMSYTGMSDEIELSRVEEYHEEKKKASVTMDTIKIRNPMDKDFKDIQKPGYVQNWALTPVESQKPSINWKQDINDTDKPKGHLASFQQGNTGSQVPNGINANMKISAGQMKSIMERNYIAMTQNTYTETSSTISAALAEASDSKISAAIDNMHTQGYENKLISLAADAGMDPLFIFAIIVVESTGDSSYEAGLMQTIKNKPGPNNPEQGIINGIEVYKGEIIAYETESPVKLLTAYNNWCVGVNIETVPDDILYTEMLYKYKETWRSSENRQYFGKVCAVYHELQNYNICKTSLDQTNNDGNSTKNVRFPFNDIDFKNITFVQDYDATITSAGATYADFIAFTITGDPVDVYAAGNGTVSGISGKNITISVPSEMLSVTYYDIDTQSVSVGDSVTSSSLLGSISQSLKVKMVSTTSNTTVDPKIYYAALSNTQVGNKLKEG